MKSTLEEPTEIIRRKEVLMDLDRTWTEKMGEIFSFIFSKKSFVK